MAPKQRQHRLRAHELEQLTADYRSGVAINDLAARYAIDRHTVIQHMRRQSVPRRYPRLDEAGVSEAIRLYQSGESLTALKSVLESGAPTVRNKSSGHGQGATPVAAPEYLAEYAIALVASNIILLVNANASVS